MQQQVPIPTAHLFPILDQKLIELLKSLAPDEWNRPTIAKKWTVKDIAAHLLDGNIRTLSLSRDKHPLPPNRSLSNYQELVDYLNELNAQWVTAAKRISPSLLAEMLESTGKEFCKYIATLEPFENAIFSVAWAGESTSKNWFHVAREYTEKFIHQQQIRDAVNKPGLITQELFFPFLETCMQALPYAYRKVTANEGTVVAVIINSEAGGQWYLYFNSGKWQLEKLQPAKISASCTLDPDTAWQLFSKGISPDEARNLVVFTGEKQLAEPALHLLPFMV